MSESFSVGEIAEYCNSIVNPELNGQECEIIGSLRMRPVIWPDGSQELTFAYQTRASDGRIFGSEPHQLRKRRPPPDWVKLCNLTDLPREVVCE